jgi:uncharacterized membrane protein required for colicin V production
VNWFDVVLAVLFAVGIVGGYFQGLIRQALSLGALVCGIILTTYLHLPVAAWLAFMFPDTAVAVTGTASLLLTLLLVVTALEVAQRKAVPETRLPAIGTLDRIAGALVAVVPVTLQLSVGVLMMNFLITPGWPIGGTFRLLLIRGMSSSILAPALYSLMVMLITVIGALLPQGRLAFPTFP